MSKLKPDTETVTVPHPTLSLHEACTFAEQVNARVHWRVISIHQDTREGRQGYVVRAHNCGVIWTMDHIESDEDLTYLENYGM
jgi:hypothetical protein